MMESGKVDKGLDYEDILKVEFKDMLQKFLEPRENFHAYAISRMCTQATMIGYDYGYYTFASEDGYVGKYLDLGEFGVIAFKIDCRTNYGKIVSENSNEVINKFVSQYPVVSEITPFSNKNTLN